MKTLLCDFGYDEQVVTPNGETGIVVMIGWGESGIEYKVKVSGSLEWFKEDQLRKAEVEK